MPEPGMNTKLILEALDALASALASRPHHTRTPHERTLYEDAVRELTADPASRLPADSSGASLRSEEPQ